MARILSGVQPSGKIHIGNYFGAIRQHIAMQEDNECFYMIANLHSLTTVKDKEKLQQATLDLALDYLAFGLDPKKSTFFLQSEIPEHAECTWVLSTLCNMGLLERAHAWKDAQEKGKKETSVGLFTYPILMAADILLYEPDLVPVGKDQKQHVEIARDVAQKFNNTYGETFKLPEADIPEEVAVVPGTDGQKMSKSYGNTIDVFADEAAIKKAIMGIQTASTPLEDPMETENCNVLALYKLMATEEELEDIKKKYQAGGFGYGNAKKALLEKFYDYFGEFRQKRIELEQNMDYVYKVLEEGSERAWAQASSVMDKIKAQTGLKIR